MRKIETKEVTDARNKIRTRWLTIVILGLLVFSSVGYAFFSNPNAGTKTTANEKVQYNGNQWVFQYGGQSQYVNYGLDDVSNVSVSMLNTIGTYSNQVVYYAINNSGVAYEIASNLQRYSARMQSACYGNCSLDLPQKTCSDNMIVWNPGSENKVYQVQNCVFIEGDLKAADAFLYRIFGLT